MPVLTVDAARTRSFPGSLLTNGGFEIWQRGAGPFTTHKGFHADEWNLGTFGSTSSVTREGSIVKFGNYSCKVDVSAVGQPPSIRAGLEEYKGLEGLWLTFSCWVYAPSYQSVRLELHDYNGTAQSAAGESNTTVGAWQHLTVSKQIRTGLLPSTGYFPGLWPHDYGISARVVFKGVGAFYVDGATIAPGYYPEGVDYAPLAAPTDMRRAQRYYEISETSTRYRGVQLESPGGIFEGFDHGAMDLVRRFTVRKSAVPTLTYSGFTTLARNSGIGLDNVSDQGFNWSFGDGPNTNTLTLFLWGSINNWKAEVI